MLILKNGFPSFTILMPQLRCHQYKLLRTKKFLNDLPRTFLMHPWEIGNSI